MTTTKNNPSHASNSLINYLGLVAATHWLDSGDNICVEELDDDHYLVRPSGGGRALNLLVKIRILVICIKYHC